MNDPSGWNPLLDAGQFVEFSLLGMGNVPFASPLLQPGRLFLIARQAGRDCTADIHSQLEEDGCWIWPLWKLVPVDDIKEKTFFLLWRYRPGALRQ